MSSYIKGEEVKELLGITRGVLEEYVKSGKLKVTRKYGNRTTGYSLASVLELKSQIPRISQESIISGDEAAKLLQIGKCALRTLVKQNKLIVERKHLTRVTGYDRNSVIQLKEKLEKKNYCNSCQLEISNNKSTGLCSLCYRKKHRQDNLENYNRLAATNKKRRYHTDPLYRQASLDSNRIWSKKNHARVIDTLKKAYHRRYPTDLNYKLRILLRTRVHKFLKGKVRGGSAVRDLGCSLETLKKHLESQFQTGMTWENHKPDGWHIDHITPLVSFDLTDPDQFKYACHYTNLQPLWAKDNLKKGSKI